jgi:hypothetical protein
MNLEMSSTGIQIRGTDSYHVVKIKDEDKWLLIRLRNGVANEAAEFSSPDEARAFALCLELEISPHK